MDGRDLSVAEGDDFEGGLKRGMPLDLGVKLGKERVEVIRLPGLERSARLLFTSAQCRHHSSAEVVSPTGGVLNDSE
jgi:hypothetical protein